MAALPKASFHSVSEPEAISAECFGSPVWFSKIKILNNNNNKSIPSPLLRITESLLMAVWRDQICSPQWWLVCDKMFGIFW